MKIDITKTAKQNLLQQINFDNDTVYNDRHVEFDPPEVYVEQGDPRNTKVVMRAVLGEGFSGYETFYYIRLGLLTGMVNAPTTIVTQTDAPLDRVKVEIANALGLILEELEFYDLIMPVDSLTQGSVRLQARADSLIYTGSQALILTV